MNILFKFFLCLREFGMRKKRALALSSVLLFFLPCFFTQALTISPAKADLTGAPGQIIYVEHTLVNEQDSSKTYNLTIENFGKLNIPKPHSHSMVAGGFEDISYTTRPISLMEFVIFEEISNKSLVGKSNTSAVMVSSETTARSAKT